MALKGTTRIELTNVKTGQKEVIEKDNLVTNAVPSLLENPFALQLKATYSRECFAGNILPLCPNLFGGILLYEDAIPEDVNQLYAQSDNRLIGYSSNNVNDKTDIMRGSMNQNESGALEDGTGYRYVFDFTTSQANGAISAVGLTSKWGGIAGYGSNEWANTQSPSVFTERSEDVTNNPSYIEKGMALGNVVHYDEETGIATSVYVSGQNTITATKIKLNTKKWRLIGSLSLIDFTDDCYSVQILETKVFASVADPSNRKLYQTFCDGGDGYIWGFEHSNNAAGNSSGKADINWIKIKLEDLSITEGTWEVDAQLYYLGVRSNTANPNAPSPTNIVNASVLDGHLYCINYAKTGVYKINLENITDVKLIEGPNKKVSVTNGDSVNYGKNKNYFPCDFAANLTVVGNRVCIWDGWLNVDTFVPQKNEGAFHDVVSDSTLRDGWLVTANPNRIPSRNLAGLSPLKLGAFLLYYAQYLNNAQNTVRANLLLNSPYLATINNLPTPVQKTADKTMKITYILREEITTEETEPEVTA